MCRSAGMASSRCHAPTSPTIRCTARTMAPATPLSHLQKTVTPTGAATYSWTDTEAHDGSFDHWVIAENNTGYSPASDVATLFNGSSLLYTNGKTAQDLMPAQAGADVTGSNTAADTVNVNGVASHLLSPIANLMPAQAGADVTGSNTALNTTNVGNQTASTVAGAATGVLLQNPNFAAGNVGWNSTGAWTVVAGAGYAGSGYFARYTGTGNRPM